MKLIIEDDEGRKTVVPVLRDEISIGRNDECLVRLSEKNVSRKHGRLLREAGHFYIEDLNSFTGIRVNGEKITGKHLIREGDLVEISEYDLFLQAAPGEKPVDEIVPTGEPLGDDDEPTAVRAEPPAPPAETAAAEDDSEARKMAETATIRLSDLKPLDEIPAVDVPVNERPRLIGISGNYRGKELPLDRTPIRLGRSGENDIEIDHPSISRKHCRLHLDNGVWKVMDAESRNGVRVNGENYASIGLRHGDVLEIGHLRFAFVAAGQPFKLPSEFAPVSGIGAQQRPSHGKGIAVGVIVGVLIAGAAAFFLWQHQANSREAEQEFALKNADEAISMHHYAEALRSLDAARRAGAKAAQLSQYADVQNEARSEDLYREMESAAASQDWEHARKVLGVLATSKTYWGGKAAERGDSITSGYVNLHVAAAALMKGKDNQGCLSEAQLALAANSQSVDAQQLAEACRQPLPPAAVEKPAPTPVKTASFVPEKRAASAAPRSESSENDARRLMNDGNGKLVQQDYAGAVASFQKALALKPSTGVLGGLYRSMGIAYTRQGDIEQGAHYYKLYLPLCTNAAEKAQLQKVLDDYEARKR